MRSTKPTTAKPDPTYEIPRAADFLNAGLVRFRRWAALAGVRLEGRREITLAELIEIGRVSRDERLQDSA